jgi:hypothetical protein
MSEPPTILIREIDDDRTLIDPIALSDPDPPFEGSGRALSTPAPVPRPNRAVDDPRGSRRAPPARLHRRVRSAIEVGAGPVGVFVIVLAVVMGLGSVAYQQWRAAAALRDMITEMNARQDATRSQDFAASPGRALAPPGNGPTLAWARQDVSPADREDAERRGASLIASNDFERALSHYRALAGLFANEAAFRDIVVVLEAKLGCSGRAETASLACR